MSRPSDTHERSERERVVIPATVEAVLPLLVAHARRAGVDVPAGAAAFAIFTATSHALERAGGWYKASRLLQRVDAAAGYLSRGELASAAAIVEELEEGRPASPAQIKARIVELASREAEALRVGDVAAWRAARRGRNALEVELTRLASAAAVEEKGGAAA